MTAKVRQSVLEWKKRQEQLGYLDTGNLQSSEKAILVVRYIPDLSWYLLVKQDTGAMVAELNEKLWQAAGLIAVVILIIILIITSVIKKFNTKMTRLLEERQALFKETTEKIYDNIYELNITKNCAASKKTELYLRRWALKTVLMRSFYGQWLLNS